MPTAQEENDPGGFRLPSSYTREGKAWVCVNTRGRTGGKQSKLHRSDLRPEWETCGPSDVAGLQLHQPQPSQLMDRDDRNWNHSHTQRATSSWSLLGSQSIMNLDHANPWEMFGLTRQLCWPIADGVVGLCCYLISFWLSHGWIPGGQGCQSQLGASAAHLHLTSILPHPLSIRLWSSHSVRKKSCEQQIPTCCQLLMHQASFLPPPRALKIKRIPQRIGGPSGTDFGGAWNGRNRSCIMKAELLMPWWIQPFVFPMCLILWPHNARAWLPWPMAWHFPERFTLHVIWVLCHGFTGDPHR